jgi:hypothetical protein
LFKQRDTKEGKGQGPQLATIVIRGDGPIGEELEVALSSVLKIGGRPQNSTSVFAKTDNLRSQRGRRSRLMDYRRGDLHEDPSFPQFV